MNRRYDAFGIGNALVDMEFSIDDSFLTENGLDKGHMTLVDEPRHDQLIASLRSTPAQRGSGGSAANTMIAVRGFGGSAFYACRVSGDETGAYFIRDLNQAGIDTNEHRPVPGTTGKCIVLVTPDAERTMNTFLGISQTLCRDDVTESAVRDAHWLYMEGYLASSPSGCDAACHARTIAESASTRTSITLSDLSMVSHFRDGLAMMIGNGVDQLFCNIEEALAWAGTDRLDVAASALCAMARVATITLGARGALVASGTSRTEVPGVRTSAVDTNGAGDMFAGAVLYGLTHGLDQEAATRFANHAAAQLVAVRGPRLPFARYAQVRDEHAARSHIAAGD